MPKLNGLRVIRSSMHGYGVIATRTFEAGEQLAEVDGHFWHEEDDLDDTYSLYVEDGLYYDMVDQTRWINHSCNPNAEVEAELDEENGARARIVAIRSIAPGDEIAYDYAFPAELAEVCKCGSGNCRGYIVDIDELDELLAQRRERATA